MGSSRGERQYCVELTNGLVLERGIGTPREKLEVEYQQEETSGKTRIAARRDMMSEGADQKHDLNTEAQTHEPETLEVIQRSNATQEDGAFERRVDCLFEAQFESGWLDEWIDERDQFLALVAPTEPIWQAINAWAEGIVSQFTPEGVEEMYGIWLKLCEILRIDPGVDLSDCLGVDDLQTDWDRYRLAD